ncbi:hypothetical protein F511_13569 [Dorcoceras hygrometricum]|uniref:Dystroglycan-like n=1 Tax=Dorcoceras hygrometricum TaxID=472368 RepID=A0A2Z7D037_9LAMI|nr:hypothetical protein F511_13569 [Dorcoceras hygrometricum]
MASSLISSSYHIDFDSGFGFDDAELVQMFESLITTGLKVFLGCPAVFYEAALTEFFANSSVRNGVVVSTIKGTAIEISEEVFATTFELPTEGLTDLSKVPKNLVFDARSLFSESTEQVSVSCLKKELKIAYRLLSNILAKTVYIKAGYFDVVTCDRFMLMTAIMFDVKVNLSSLLFGLELGESRAFPIPRVLTEKTVHKYVVINEKVGTEEVADAPRVKKTPVKKAVSQRRPAEVDVEVAPVVKKKRTTKGKPVVIAQKAVPLQIIEGTAVVLVEQPPVPKRKWQMLRGSHDRLYKNEVPRQRSYDDTLPPETASCRISKFTLSVVEPDSSFYYRRPTAFALRLSQFCTIFIHYSLFSSLTTEDIRSFVGSIASERTVLRYIQIIQSSGSVADTEFVAQRIPLVLDQHSSSTSSSEESMNFDDHDTATVTFSLPAAATPDVTEALDQLRATIEQIRERDDGAKIKDTLLLHLHDLERKFTARFDAQDRVLGALRKDSNDQRSLLSLDFKSSHKQLGTQIATTALDLVDVRRVVREHYQELNAKITSLDDQVAATQNDLLEFRAQAQQTLNIITDQLGELVSYINRGGNDKKGEVVSSSRHQPPPDDQNRDSGIAGGGGGDTDRSIVERLITADKQRQRERSRGHSSGSYKRRRY